MRTFLLVLLLAAGAARADADPRGLWLTASGNLEVRIAPCGAALCGKVAHVIANHSMSRPGEAMAEGAQPAQEGMDILSDFLPSARETTPDGASVVTEWRGRIFNRENGKTYNALMSVGKGGELRLRGYVGLPLFGKTQVWQPVVEAKP
ncbi:MULTISPECIES: DUF2147 domain-containing protein [unclassified Roseateles]|uniref:DUF2147 domain-containing protein n=1 Tax=unclassified Roseateles TaxID=2626991 RepID=UPI0006F3C6A9|nr:MULTISPECIES: DUF2147 domain-containing protein [unclassified Roseateles]KQW46250.1 hypothetical protein ASC81_07490 [Pelomonas sp. Root405]KRA73299.1 hypothetical protein ASD88_07490 [Pelomonas sp. Root662]